MGWPTGKPLSAEHKAKLSARFKGRKLSPEWAARLKVILTERNQTESMREIARQPRAPFTEEHKARISAGKVGKKPNLSDEQRAEMRARLIARNQSDEMRAIARRPKPEGFGAKVSAALKGRKGTPWSEAKHAVLDEHIRSLGESHAGVPKSEAHKHAISEATKGRVHPEDARIRMSFSHQEPETIAKHREDRLHQVFPQKDSGIELAVQAELAKRDITFEKHYPILGQPDIAFPTPKVAVFLDGDYWHGLNGAKDRDVRVSEALRQEGWLVLRYSETEVNANVEALVDELLDALTSRGFYT